MTTIYDLAKNPAAQQRLVEQVDAFFASRPNHDLSYEDLEHFSYLEAAFNVGACLTHLPHSRSNAHVCCSLCLERQPLGSKLWFSSLRNRGNAEQW